MTKLITTSNPKTIKGMKYAFATAILHLAPHKLSGHLVCPNASASCIKLCLHTAGNPIYQTGKDRARIRRTKFYFEKRQVFMIQLHHELQLFIKLQKRKRLVPTIRPNGTSDLIGLGVAVAKWFPDVQVYDYTKNFSSLLRELPKNYHLTFSRSETNWSECVKALQLGFNVAVVFKDEIPETFAGYKVINGDETDLRFLDKRGGYILALTAKGLAKQDNTGFALTREQVAEINAMCH